LLTGKAMITSPKRNLLTILILIHFPVIIGYGKSNSLSGTHNSCLTSVNEIDSLYQKGIKALQNKDTIRAQYYFKESIRQNDDEQSLFELVNIQVKQNTFISRNYAYENLSRLVMLEPANLLYRYAYADLCKDFSRPEATSQYRKILNQDSLQAKAWLELADLKAKDFDEYNNSVRAADEFYFELQSFADEDFLEAEKYFTKALSIDSQNSYATLQFALLYEKAGKYEEGINLLNKYLQKEKGDKEFYLVLGLMFYKTSKLRECYDEYKIALKMMNEKEREDFTFSSVKFLLEPAFKDITDTYSEDELKEFISLYWKVFDPLYMTNYNERLLEHYSRVAYSNLHFSVPKMKIVGWKSDRGEVVLRYGEPLNKMRIRPAMEGNTVNMKTEVWNYRDMVFGFGDMTLSGNYKYVAPPAEKDKARPQFAGDSNSLIDYLRQVRYTSYNPKYEGPTFDVPYYYSQLKNYEKRNHTDLYLSYGVAKADSILPNKEKKSGYDLGFSMFEQSSFDELIKTNGSVERMSSNTFDHDTLKTLHAQVLKVTSPSDSGYVAFELVRRKDKGVFSNHGKLVIRKFSSNNLDMSDIILASDVKIGSPDIDLINRKDFRILPKPDRCFGRTDPLFIYYEAYNLKRDSNLSTNFDQSITIMKVEEKSNFQETVSSIGKFLGLSGEEKITLTSHYSTEETDPQMYLQLDLTKYEAGNYLITVEIIDNANNKTVSSSIIVDWRN
jgi:GWxTD domain-containing protein